METAARKTATYEEIEFIKRHVRMGGDAALLLLGLAYALGCKADVTLTEYISQWAAASNAPGIGLVKELYPLCGERKIADGRSEWNSYG